MDSRYLNMMRYLCSECVPHEGCYYGMSLSIISLIFQLHTMNEEYICNEPMENYMDEIDMNWTIYELNDD